MTKNPDALGITDSTLSRKLRRELTAEESAQMCAAINRIAGKKKEDDTNE